MVSSTELLFLVMSIGAVFFVPLLYAVVAHFLIFRKENEKPSFFKHFVIYLGIYILVALLATVISGIFISMEATSLLALKVLSLPYVKVLLESLSAILIALLGSIWIKHADKTSIGIVASFKVVAIVFVVNYIFSFFLTHGILSYTTTQSSSKQDPKKIYEYVMNLPLSDDLKNFKHVSGEEYGLFTNLVFTYTAPDSYFTTLKHHKKFKEPSEWNRSFDEKDCYPKREDTICYEGTVFPYIHNLKCNKKTKFVTHTVIGMRD